MTCPTPTAADAAAHTAPEASDRHTAIQAHASTPAQITSQTLNGGGSKNIIASRCDRLPHTNQVQRDRYLSLHQILASRPSSRSLS